MIFVFVFLLTLQIQTNQVDEFAKMIESGKRPLFETGIPESPSFVREDLALIGHYNPKVSKKTEEECDITYSGEVYVFDDVKYVELTNAATLETFNKDKTVRRKFLVGRGIRTYEPKVTFPDQKIAVSINPYIGDVLLFEFTESKSNSSLLKRRNQGEWKFVKRLITSSSEKDFFFEDPRIHYISEKEQEIILLSGTHYVPSKGYVMNKFLELEISDNGEVKDIEIDPKTKIPILYDISPENKNYIWAKDGIIFKNENDELCVRTRLMMNFSDPHVKNYTKGKISWNYGEQVFKFKNLDELKNYNWDNAIFDLFIGGGDIKAKVLLIDSQIKEHLQMKEIIKGNKGFGPGCFPVRISRKGEKLYISKHKSSSQEEIGTIPKDFQKDFLMKDNDAAYLSFDHEIRWLDSFQARFYDVSFKAFTGDFEEIIVYYADVIQPTTDNERGVYSGIVDLQCIFPMGYFIEKEMEKSFLYLYTGSGNFFFSSDF